MTSTNEILTYAEVRWIDAYSDTNSWITADDIDQDACETTTVGILLTGAKIDHITIAQSVNAFGLIDSVLFIPVGMVRGMRLLAMTDPHKPFQ